VTEPLERLIHYRPDRAQESLEDARLLAEANRWNACVNRLYYSCFYAVSALLVRDGLSSSRHTGVRSLLNRHYVRTGKVPRDLACVYNDLFERRQEGIMLILCVFRPTKFVLGSSRPRCLSPL
jgi:uncharacterized protein (UPF0332 family)